MSCVVGGFLGDFICYFAVLTKLVNGNIYQGDEMPDYNKIEMPNGVSVADWMGTASNSARIAAGFLDDMRVRGNSAHLTIKRVEDELVEALGEVRMIRQQLEL